MVHRVNNSVFVSFFHFRVKGTKSSLLCPVTGLAPLLERTIRRRWQRQRRRTKEGGFLYTSVRRHRRRRERRVKEKKARKRERGRACPWCACRWRNYGIRHGHARAKLFALPLMPRLSIANLPHQSIGFLIFLLPPSFSIVTSSSTSNCSTSVFD